MHNANWFRPFVEHLVCTSKTQGCKTTLNCYPNPYKRKNHQHRGSPWVVRHPRTAFHKEKWGKGGVWVGEKERTNIKIKNGGVRQSAEGGALVAWWCEVAGGWVNVCLGATVGVCVQIGKRRGLDRGGAKKMKGRG
jgi:hypothetical protein